MNQLPATYLDVTTEPVQPLTKGQLRILELAAQGYTRKYIAKELGKAPATIKNQMTDIIKRLHARNCTHAVYLVFCKEYSCTHTNPMTTPAALYASLCRRSGSPFVSRAKSR